MPEPESRPVLMRQPAQVLDRWERQGKVLQLSRDAFSKTADGWLWPGPVTDEERTIFWSIVQAARCVLFEHMNDAVLGLVWIDGTPVVAYDVAEMRRIQETKRAVSKQEDIDHADQRDDAQMNALLTQSWGIRTPVFRML